ncbi:MAG: hypothetical protein WCT03_08035 [Candidatus Obscuribacterales bacterium]|jgi:hypothetical protein
MKNFNECFKQATGLIGPEYFLLPTYEGSEVKRERVYCYELYHQLRVAIGEHAFKLHGEVDKAAHPMMALAKAAKKPDFIIHSPGTKRNHLVMEVKNSNGAEGITKDIETLKLFKTEASYERAILLIYGENIDGLVSRVQNHPNKSFLELWWHQHPLEPCRILF